MTVHYRRRWPRLLWPLAIIFVLLMVFFSRKIVRLVQSEDFWKPVPIILLGMLALGFVSIWIFQIRRRRPFPQIASKYLVSIPPLLLTVGAFAAYMLSPSAQLNNTLTALFGAATVMGMTLSLVVLISLRNSFSDEISLGDHAAELIRSCRNRLIFLALTPNLGFAGAARRGEFRMCISLTLALRHKLPELAKKAQAGDATVCFALLSEADQQTFYERKKGILKSFRGETTDTAADAYEKYTKQVRDAIRKAHMDAGSPNFRLFYWREGCCEFPDERKPDVRSPHFPPLGIIIADRDVAIISYNAALMNDQPVDLRGRLIQTADEVESFSTLVNAYIRQYAQPNGGEPASCPDPVSER